MILMDESLSVLDEERRGNAMDLRFLRGTEAAPRGHAIIFARSAAGRGHAYATYCFIPPIQVSLGSLGRYLPPIFTQQFGLDTLREMSGQPSAMPFPPMLEEIDHVDDLIAMADARSDDVIEIQGIGDVENDMKRMELAAQVSAEYGQMYLRYSGSPAFRAAASAAPSVLDEAPISLPAANFNTMLGADEPTTDVQQLGEITRLIGTLRFAIETRDQKLQEETTRSLRRSTAPLAEKYHAEELIVAANTAGIDGQHLTELYLERAYKLAEENYAAIPPLDQQIAALKQAMPPHP